MADQPDVILRRPEVERFTGLKTSSLYERIAAGTFPRPVRIHSRAVGWLSSEIAAWQRQLVAERDAKLSATARATGAKR